MNYTIGGILIILLFTSCERQVNTDIGGGEKTPDHHFMFQIANVETPRQGGQKINFFIKSRYEDGLDAQEYIDYRVIRKIILEYVQPSDALPDTVYWEVINEAIVTRIVNNFPFEAVSLQMQVFPNNDSLAYEPGFHSSICTIGEIEPLEIPGLLEYLPSANK